jgi:hypothetical protein
MLFPVVLFGAVWADLNRPVPEVAQCWAGGKFLNDPYRAYYLLRGRVLVRRLRPGMTMDEAEGVLGPDIGVNTGERGALLYGVLGVTIVYTGVHATPLSDIAALFLPDRPRRR